MCRNLLAHLQRAARKSPEFDGKDDADNGSALGEEDQYGF